MGGEAGSGRRPLKSRSSGWARWAAAALARTAITPNAVSVASVGFAILGVVALWEVPEPACLLLFALCIQLRLLCNLLDGMLAIEGGKRSSTGVLYNELPDRIADALFLVALGYFVRLPALGWCSAWLAVLTAYIRVLGGALGLAQDFRGPMAKPHRMAVLTGAALLGTLEHWVWGSHYTLVASLWVVALGSLFTCVRRTRAIAGELRTRASGA